MQLLWRPHKRSSGGLCMHLQVRPLQGKSYCLCAAATRLPAAQNSLALAVWCLAVALFLAVLALMAGRLLTCPARVHELLASPNQSLFLGALPMTISAITAGLLVVLGHR